jgi:hypothetical protein
MAMMVVEIQLKRTAMELAAPRAFDANTSVTKNQGIEPLLG